MALGQDILVARITPWRTLRCGHSSCVGSSVFSDHLAESIAAGCRRTRVPAAIYSDLDRSPAVLESSDPLFQHHLCSGMDLCAFSLVASTTTLALIECLVIGQRRGQDVADYPNQHKSRYHHNHLSSRHSEMNVPVSCHGRIMWFHRFFLYKT